MKKRMIAANEAIRLNPQLPFSYLLKSQALVTTLSLPPITKGEGREARLRWFGEAADALDEIPCKLDKRSEERELWTSQLEALRFLVRTQSKRGVDPDFPDTSEITARVLSKPEPQYTEEARRHQIVGTVILRAVFAADGKVKLILVIKALPRGLTERAVEAARRIKFTPATLNGRPVSNVYPTGIQLQSLLSQTRFRDLE